MSPFFATRTFHIYVGKQFCLKKQGRKMKTSSIFSVESFKNVIFLILEFGWTHFLVECYFGQDKKLFQPNTPLQKWVFPFETRLLDFWGNKMKSLAVSVFIFITGKICTLAEAISSVSSWLCIHSFSFPLEKNNFLPLIYLLFVATFLTEPGTYSILFI